MNEVKKSLSEAFQELDQTLGSGTEKKAEIILMGQASLFMDEGAAAVLNLTQTGDVDAILNNIDDQGRAQLKSALERRGFLFDSTSEKVWVPPKARAKTVFEGQRLAVRAAEPETVLLSKAITDPRKNKPLIRQAIASGLVPKLALRIEEQGGDLEFFARG